MGPAAVFVKKHEVIKVGDGSLGPFISKFSLLEFLDWIPNYFDSVVEMIELFKEMTEELFGIESNKFGGTIVHKYLDGVVHLTEFSRKNLIDFVQQNMLLD